MEAVATITDIRNSWQIMRILYIKIKYTLKTDTYQYVSDIKQDKLTEITADALRQSFGAGGDSRKPNMLPVYTITVFVNVATGTISVESDCGNLSLETGLLLGFHQYLVREEKKAKKKKERIKKGALDRLESLWENGSDKTRSFSMKCTKRTSIDWSKHEYKRYSDTLAEVFELKIPNSCTYRVRITNTLDAMLVTGDFGHWTFTRTFYPNMAVSPVSDDYFLEKAEECSNQTAKVMDWTAISLELHRDFDDLKSEFGETTEDVMDYYKYLQNFVGDDDDYQFAICTALPDGWGIEDAPWYTMSHPRLKVIFDAMDEMCRREEAKND